MFGLCVDCALGSVADGCSRFHTTFESLTSLSFRSQPCSWCSWWSWWSWCSWWSWWSGDGNHSDITTGFHIFFHAGTHTINEYRKLHQKCFRYFICLISIEYQCIHWYTRYEKTISIYLLSKLELEFVSSLLSIPIFCPEHKPLYDSYSRSVSTH